MQDSIIKKVIFMFLLSIFSLPLYVEAMKTSQSIGVTAEHDVSIMDLPAEVDDYIFSFLIPENLITSEDVVDALRKSVGILASNSYFEQFKNIFARKIVENVTKSVEKDRLKDKRVNSILQRAFEIAIDKNYQRVALILYLTNRLDKKALGSVNFLKRVFVTNLEKDKIDILTKTLAMLKIIHDQGFDISVFFKPVGQQSLLGNLIKEALYGNEEAKKRIVLIHHFVQRNKESIRELLKLNNEESLLNFLTYYVINHNIKKIDPEEPYIFMSIDDQKKSIEVENQLYNYALLLLDLAKIDNELVRYLLETPSQSGNIPLHSLLLQSKPDKRLITLLLKRGIESNSQQLEIQNNKRKTAVDLAQENGHRKIRKLIDKAKKNKLK